MPLFATLPGMAQIRDAGTVTVAEFDTLSAAAESAAGVWHHAGDHSRGGAVF